MPNTKQLSSPRSKAVPEEKKAKKEKPKAVISGKLFFANGPCISILDGSCGFIANTYVKFSIDEDSSLRMITLKSDLIEKYKSSISSIATEIKEHQAQIETTKVELQGIIQSVNTMQPGTPTAYFYLFVNHFFM